MKIALICGGPSLERGISLNSARSVADHLSSDAVSIAVFYLDSKKRAYQISPVQLYSNTPSDFDFKLQDATRPLSQAQFLAALRACDLVFPVMHGPYGEDGGIQSFLERAGIPFVGSGSAASRLVFDKFNANEALRKNGFFVLPSIVLRIYASDHRQTINRFFREHAVSRAAVKPASGGSSIGVFSVTSPKEALEKATILFSKRMDTRVVVEQFATGSEFTVIVLQSRFGLPVALPPTEIETDYTRNQIFDFRRKYLPTRQVTWHCPPRFDDPVVEKIQAMAEQLFAMFGLRDFARFDGWVLPDGNIWFCDFNPVSGMEQNSFLFQQASRIGLTHGQVLRHIVESACAREGITPPLASPPLAEGRADVNILFGGDTSERQVSLMSGTNVWLRLRDSRLCTPHPFLLAPDRSVWRLPYHLALNHTVEEIVENCRNYPRDKERMGRFEDRARLRLGLPAEKDTREFFDPVKMNMKDFLSNSKIVFNALHGGSGEDGRIQKLLHSHGVAFNGSDERTSALCMDKFATSRRIAALAIPGVEAIPAETVATRDILAASVADRAALWRQVKRRLRAKTIVVKPRADGCSTAVVHCHTSIDFGRYLDILSSGTTQAPPGTFYNQFDPIEFPEEVPAELILERFIETDIIRIKDRRLKHLRRTGWVETTVGVIEFRDGLRALSPSITVADGEVLSVEEKFQGGTGVNLTPPPMVPNRILQRVRERIRTLATRLGIRGYCRVDAFIHITTGDIMIIEINTLPGLTPATVLYHQALAEVPPMTPRVLLEHIVTQSKP